MAGEKNVQANPAIKFGVLIVLLIALSFVLVHFNILSCGFYSEVGCDIYYSIIAGGKPKVLIVSGESGIGEPEYLYEVLKSPRFGARVGARDLAVISLPELMGHQLVIVERAREMKIGELKMFQDYVARGGRLVWIADAGTAAPQGEDDLNYFLTNKDRKVGGNSEFISPWARRSDGRQVSFDHLLGVEFLGNYCEFVPSGCQDGSIIGYLDVAKQDHRLGYGISQNLALYGDFSVVDIDEDAYETTVAYLNYGTGLIATPDGKYFWLKSERQNFGRDFPAIVSSGVGGRVAYYAFPPEYFVGERMPLDTRSGERVAYWAIIENLYYGMLYKP